MRKAVIAINLFIGLLFLNGCAKNEIHANHKNEGDEVIASESSAASVWSEPAEKTTEATHSLPLWDTQKADEFRHFMKNWESTTNQSYKEYQPNENVNYYGIKLPDDVLGIAKERPIAVNRTIVTAEWSNTGKSTSDYSIVAVYSDVQTGVGLSPRQVYFFGFCFDHPVVLVTTQKQEASDGALHFTQVKNHELEYGFQNIAERKTAEAPIPSTEAATTDWTSMDEAIVFYEKTFKNTENEVSKQIIWENYDRNCWQLTEKMGNQIVLHLRNPDGTGGSFLKFEKYLDHTKITKYVGENSYPNSPSKKYNVRNSDHRVI